MSEEALLPARSPFSYSLKQISEDSVDENDKDSLCVSSYFDDDEGNGFVLKNSF